MSQISIIAKPPPNKTKQNTVADKANIKKRQTDRQTDNHRFDINRKDYDNW